MPIEPRDPSTLPGSSSRRIADSRSQTHSISWRAHPEFPKILAHLQDPILPLIPINSPSPLPEFPTTILAYHLLTHSQLDFLARAFHQVWPPVPETLLYPVRMPPWIGTVEEGRLDLRTKRRRWGYFIGLGDCQLFAEEESSLPSSSTTAQGISDNGCEPTPSDLVNEFLESVCSGVDSEIVQQMLLGMEREWEDAMERARAARNPWSGPKSLFWD
ncbi:hypothetical protein N7468_005578 [Penicillium chermesinum]|uniref:Uncharacterized protein n=1 Tax=Penicillium chermesinum TaxID=63820 RepID=A0A9W9NZJ8_9EURO|nr:uncharacterized protein N7468_005578 [Penicillium chermesinum]KAJ5232622.1 hypothetical protein N7468_005578 [Penicillium chermesinum]